MSIVNHGKLMKSIISAIRSDTAKVIPRTEDTRYFTAKYKEVSLKMIVKNLGQNSVTIERIICEISHREVNENFLHEVELYEIETEMEVNHKFNQKNFLSALLEEERLDLDAEFTNLRP